MEKPKFKIGDIVQLKSGGPEMTVASDQPEIDLPLTPFSALSQKKFIANGFPVANWNLVLFLWIP